MSLGGVLALLWLPLPSVAMGDNPRFRGPGTRETVVAGAWLAQGKPAQPPTGAQVEELIRQANALKAKGAYGEAAGLWEQILAIVEQLLGPEHPDTATSLNNLALLYRKQGRYGEAEPLYKRSLAIREKVLGPEHPDTATSLNNLAGLYEAQGRYGDAEPLYKRSLAIYEKVLGPEHPTTATSLNNLAVLYLQTKNNTSAEPLLQRHNRSQASWLLRELPLQPRELRSSLIDQQPDAPPPPSPCLTRAPLRARWRWKPA
jgi:tetratricopeptide (TPR) repeat protein